MRNELSYNFSHSNFIEVFFSVLNPFTLVPFVEDALVFLDFKRDDDDIVGCRFDEDIIFLERAGDVFPFEVADHHEGVACRHIGRCALEGVFLLADFDDAQETGAGIGCYAALICQRNGLVSNDCIEAGFAWVILC